MSQKFYHFTVSFVRNLSVKKITWNYMLQVHSIHQDVKNFPCQLCSKRYNTIKSRNRHVKIVHEKSKPFACPKCDSAFVEKNKLTVHIKNVLEGCKYECDKCDKALSSKSSLRMHKQLVHDKIRKR